MFSRSFSRSRSVVVFALVSGLVACSGQDSEPSREEVAFAAPTPGAVAAAAKATAPAAASAAPTDLAAAHAAYLAGDWLALGDRLRDVLGDDPSPAVRRNALELLDKAAEVQHGTLPSSFKAPPGVTGLQYACFRIATPHGASFNVRFRGESPDAARIANMTVNGGGLHLDKLAGRGRYGVRHDPGTRGAGREEFLIDSGPIDGLPTDDAVELGVTLDDGTTYGGFVFTHRFCSSASPDVKLAATTSDPEPALSWTPFQSPEVKPFEGHRYGVQVNRDRESGVLWERWSDADNGTETRMGSDAGKPAAPLAPGRYWVAVSASERRRFGPVEVLRISRTMLPFTVQ